MADRRVTSLNQRIRNAAAAAGVAPARMRNRLVFQRILARLASDRRWILKGGFALEARLGLDSRATRDLDLLRWGTTNPTGLNLQDALEEALDVDLADGFAFTVRTPRQVRVEEVLPSTWRVVVDSHLYGSLFAEVVIDVITTEEVLPGQSEMLSIPGLFGEPPVVVATIDVHRHAAEKFHAYARIYAHDRPSSRVKDLVDLALLVEFGLDARDLGESLYEAFNERDAKHPPPGLPPPPRDWEIPFARLARETSLESTSIEDAYRRVSAHYVHALDEARHPE